MQPAGTALLTSAQPHSTMTNSGNDPMIVNVTSSSSEVTQTNLVQKHEMKSEFIGGPPPGLPPLGPDSLVITNNNGKFFLCNLFYDTGIPQIPIV